MTALFYLLSGILVGTRMDNWCTGQRKSCWHLSVNVKRNFTMISFYLYQHGTVAPLFGQILAIELEWCDMIFITMINMSAMEIEPQRAVIGQVMA